MRLYLKLYVAFAAAVLLTVLVLGGFAFALSEKNLERRFHSFLDDRARAMVQILEYVLENEGRGRSTEAAATKAAERIASWTGGEVWFLDSREGVRGASVSQAPPPFPRARHTAGPASFARDDGIWFVRARLNDGGVALLTGPSPRPYGEGSGWFALLAVALIFLILLYPFSRLLGRPLARLREGAVALAEGRLEHRVALQRGDEIGDLAQAFDQMAERLQRLIQASRELNAHVSHELRSPLARMRVALELMRDEAADRAVVDRRLAPILGDIERLDDLIGRILLLARLDLSAIQNEAFSLSATVSEALQTLSSAAAARGLKLRANVAGDVRISGDRRWIESAAINLIENALRHAPEGDGVDIRLFIEGEEIILESENSGTASDEEIQRWLQPFQRGENLDPQNEGTGLGLAILSGVARRHGGRFEIRCEAGRIKARLVLPRC